MTDLQWHDVASSNIERVAWLDETMYVKFHNGRTYKYMGVPEDVFNACKDAPSVGSFFAANVKTTYNAIQI